MNQMQTKPTLFSILKQAFQNAIKVIWKISKIMIPVYILVELLKYMNILPAIGAFLAPIMGIFGLPGETAITLILANTINIYAGIATLGSLTLTTKQITILAVMITTSHSLFLETTILHGIHVPRSLQLILRIGMMILLGLIMNWVWRVS
jgi:hypothetical protein